MALVVIGVTVSQLYRLYPSASPDTFGPRQAGILLSTFILVTAIVVILVGTSRYLRQQRDVINGNIKSGGFDLLMIWVLFSLVGSYFRPMLLQ